MGVGGLRSGSRVRRGESLAKRGGVRRVGSSRRAAGVGSSGSRASRGRGSGWGLGPRQWGPHRECKGERDRGQTGRETETRRDEIGQRLREAEERLTGRETQAKTEIIAGGDSESEGGRRDH